MWKTSRSISFLLTLAIWLASSSAAPIDFGEVLTNVKLGLYKEVLAAADPGEKVLAVVGNTLLCKPLEKVLVLDKEPDLSKLNLQFQSPEITIIFNMSDAAEQIPKLLPYYNFTRKLIIFAHGFTDNPSKASFTDLNANFEKEGIFNVLAYDTSSIISKNFNYISAAYYVKYIGMVLGKVLAALFLKGQSPDKIHCIGHSLGAHISGYAGKTFTNMTNATLGRISGLDPAGPCFANLQDDMKLKKTDAAFVDVIHTDAGVFGDDENLGDVDIYPNGGSQQPGCPTQDCSHGRVNKLYAESVTSDEFDMIACDSYELFRKGSCSGNNISKMGYNCPNTTRGIYYLQTAATAPFALGINGTNYTNNAGVIQNIELGLGDLLQV